MPNPDFLEIEILNDGTIKTVTDKVSMPNHSNAEQFLREIATLAGGETTREKRTDVTHKHSHEKVHLKH